MVAFVFVGGAIFVRLLCAAAFEFLRFMANTLEFSARVYGGGDSEPNEQSNKAVRWLGDPAVRFGIARE
jgi:hypothetical protein